MIVAQQKPIEEIQNSIRPYEKVLILGCGTCVTVCLSGGEAEALSLRETLSLAGGHSFRVMTPERQCDMEFL
jgi:ferredoxin